MSPCRAAAALPSPAAAVVSLAVAAACSAGVMTVAQAVMPEGQELLQAGGGLQGGVQEHVGAGGARAGFERG